MIIERITEATQGTMVLETKAINQEVDTQTIILGSTSLIFNNKIHFLVTMVIDLLNPTNKPSLSQTHIKVMNQILNTNCHHHYNSNSHNKALASMHQTNNSLQQRQSKLNNIQQQPNQISFIEGDDDYVNAITDFFP